jgi:hypothetical protein
VARAEGVGCGVTVGGRDLRLQAEARQGRAQLVGDVGDELTLRFPGTLEAAEQLVEGVTQFFELVVRVA